MGAESFREKRVDQRISLISAGEVPVAFDPPGNPNEIYPTFRVWRQEDLSLAVVLLGPLPVAPGSRFVESMVSESFSTDAFVDFAVL